MGVVAYGRAMLWGTGEAVALTVSVSIATIVTVSYTHLTLPTSDLV